MADFANVEKSLRERGFQVKTFATGAEAADYLDGAVDGKTVGLGGSLTLQELGVYERLSAHNTVYWHWVNGAGDRVRSASAQVYITSANGLAETGEILNIDGYGNRIASTLYGRNKLAPTYDEALWRARNIAAPKNAQRLGRKTPCAIKGDRCYDCKSPDRICCGLAVLWTAIMDMEMEVILVDEDLGL